jgi:hypothetical protein
MAATPGPAGNNWEFVPIHLTLADRIRDDGRNPAGSRQSESCRCGARILVSTALLAANRCYVVAAPSSSGQHGRALYRESRAETYANPEARFQQSGSREVISLSSRRGGEEAKTRSRVSLSGMARALRRQLALLGTESRSGIGLFAVDLAGLEDAGAGCLDWLE